MTKIDIEIFDSIIAIVNKIKNVNDSGVELNIPEGSVLFENVLNLKLLEKEAEKLDKTLHLNTNDEKGIILIKSINESEEQFSSKEDFITQDFEVPLDAKKKKFKFNTPNISALKLARLKLPKITFKGKTVIFSALIVGSFGVLGYQFIWKVPKATAKIVVNSQPLIKSIEITATIGGANSVENKTIAGYEVSSIITKTGSANTTGEKIVGDKAEGKVIIYNRTDIDIEFKKGTTVTFKDSTDLEFTLNDSVTVAAETLQDPLDPTSPSIPGEASVDVTAKDIGKKYNIDKDETLEFENYKKSEAFAITKDDFSGGNSDSIKVVTKEDMDLLSTTVFDEAKNLIEDTLKNKKFEGKKYIKGSASAVIQNEAFNAEVGDEKETIELTQELLATGVSYSEEELESMLDELLQDFVPEDFILSTKDKDITVEVLGNSDGTVLTSTKADLQVTIKSSVVPDIEEEEIKKDLLGTSTKEAEKILGGIKNIKTYELTISPNIPLLQRLPQNEENISIEIEKE